MMISNSFTGRIWAQTKIFGAALLPTVWIACSFCAMLLVRSELRNSIAGTKNFLFCTSSQNVFMAFVELIKILVTSPAPSPGCLCIGIPALF